MWPNPQETKLRVKLTLQYGKTFSKTPLFGVLGFNSEHQVINKFAEKTLSEISCKKVKRR